MSQTAAASSETPSTPPANRHFIRQIIDEDIASGKWGAPGDRSVVRTRFPPEPNGYLHIGHAKSICLNFGLAEEYGGACNLRFDDTNPTKEEQEYVDSIVADVRWLGFRWPGAPTRPEDDPTAGVLFASDYFEQMYEWGVELMRKGLAYVDDQSVDEIRAQRGSLTEPGRESPYRDRAPEENIALFEAMRRGEFPNGSRVVRAKIDMASPNFNLRDPVIYRILHARHHRTGDRWCIYPMYDWAHGFEDSIEGITHSLCTLEFENHRPLYDWFIEAVNQGRDPKDRIHHPQQIEFARWSPSYMVTSKRKLLQLVQEKRVSGWDDPRMPTISGLRRRGYTPEAIRNFCEEGGVTKYNALIDIGRLENAVRDHLNTVAPRRMCVMKPLKVVITNWGEGGDPDRVEWMEAQNSPEVPEAGTRKVPFARELYIEADDFMEDAPKKFFRLRPGGEVRLRYGYWITCREVVKNEAGEVVELRCTYDPRTRGGDAPPPDAEGNVRKVKGTLHWVSAPHAVDAEVRNFDRLFKVEQPDKAPKDADEGWSFLENLNPDSLEVVRGAKLEPEWRITEAEAQALRAAYAKTGGTPVGSTGAPADGPVSMLFPDGILRVQFERHGYYCLDKEADPASGRLVWNRTVSLKDSWAKEAGRG